MTVRAKASLSKALGSAKNIKAVWAKSHVVGEMQVQVVGYDGKQQAVYIPSSADGVDRKVNLLLYAPPSSWKSSKSLLSAVSLGHVSVTVETERKSTV